MATIKPIEGRTVHQIQSGQVIVDLCSVVKELVENSIDAGATSIDVRFKNQGLDSIEVQDNGSGISPNNYETIALKHYTSKLSTYSDLATLQTFGFRGEALSSLCALSQFSVLTCLAKDVPKGAKLEFDTSGKLKSTHVIAAQKGTNVIVENLFHNLPVRRRELERNIKREWNKVIALLNQYACIQTGVKFTVSQQPSKGKRIVLFSTKGNMTTRENLVNIFGAKTMTVMVKLDMTLKFEPTTASSLLPSQKDMHSSAEARLQGYVSRPAHGEGRQTPDRQMFFVNGRPCGLPQFAKVFNEVYRSYNSSQSPFIFADIQLDTHLYDVNVSPDKRTILLHDQSRMLENLREALIALFQSQDYSIPVAKLSTQKAQVEAQTPVVGNTGSESREQSAKVPAFAAKTATEAIRSDNSSSENETDKPTRKGRTTKPTKLTAAELQSQNLISRWIGKKADEPKSLEIQDSRHKESLDSRNDIEESAMCQKSAVPQDEDDISGELSTSSMEVPDNDLVTPIGLSRKVLDFHTRLSEVDAQDTVGTRLADIASTQDTDKENTEAEVPAITPVKAPRHTSRPLTATPRLLKRSVADMAAVNIGCHRPTGPTETQSKRARVDTGPEAREPPFDEAAYSIANLATGSSPDGRLSGIQRSKQGRLSKDCSENPDEDDSAIATDEDAYVPASSKSQVENHPDEAMSVDDVGGRLACTPGGPDVMSSPTDSPNNLSASYSDDINTLQSTVERGRAKNISLGQDNTSSRSLVLRAGIKRKDAILQYEQNIRMSKEALKSLLESWASECKRAASQRNPLKGATSIESEDAEEVLSLIISKSDFGKMTVVGQFNLGFIIAVRHAIRGGNDATSTSGDELFIIDQHASDEKYNFERLQSVTVVQSQRLVHPKQLELTALEEEIVMENLAALDINGFKVLVDDSGDQPVGSRCKLITLPLSRDTTFTLSDLEELISLLGDHLSSARSAPRPSKVRSMFAMRACRSSVMIGKALAHRQMERLVRHMGELDKPWNCPHGRPTMRHLGGLGSWDDNGWKEAQSRVNWAEYARS
ncbi:DNA mismatch repair protein pms2 [Colletotrichum truncatum]|uniref:DNA mismatch repair protein pms2 n=1 Tax=Colletotrichum truncatum TaxID=5467 RepID=A0ACC3ZJQ7_COLTU|nr:DNA mismatch repair protein pms2 [Colletotrichum truncatum]KAF6782404.1 DNA mismatch repair protein pms2 [Colletotrichum truncatum]